MSSRAATVRTVDKGLKRTLGTAEKMKGANAITVGIHQEEGGASTSSGLSVAEVAEVNEFGLGPPARPIITAYADEKGPAAIREIKARYAAALKSGKDPIVALDQLAQKYAAEVQAKYAAGTPPPNAQSTINKKGSSTPRIDRGIERASIRGKVVK